MAETGGNGARSGADKPRRPVTVAELRRRMICKKRYGRASLTIHRWGPRLVGDTELAGLINAYRDGTVSTEHVAWAFVRRGSASTHQRSAGRAPTSSASSGSWSTARTRRS
jgi:hypothetical protein